MPFEVRIEDAQRAYPEYNFIKPLSPSEQKAAFHVQDSDGNDLCFKIISPDYSVDRLEREILALLSLNHPNVVRLKEYTFSSRISRTQHYLIEEFIPGDDLSKYLVKGQCWDLKSIIPFFLQLFDGIDAIRKVELVHRDLKPSNIRVKTDFTPVIIDFGMARHLNKTDITLTAEGAALGTPLYFAPEQFNGTKHDIKHRTDLFAAGIIMYEALTGNYPFYKNGMNYSQLQEAVCNSTEYLTLPTFQQLPKNIQLIVSKLLEKERGHRPHSAELVRKILQKVEMTL